jgi:uncharacterized protein (DUF1330 family)
MLHALCFAFPFLSDNPDWKARRETVCQSAMTAEMEDILAAAMRVGASVKQQIKGNRAAYPLFSDCRGPHQFLPRLPVGTRQVLHAMVLREPQEAVMPKGYIVANIDVSDAERLNEDYASRSRPYMQRNGGRYLVRTSEIDQREGDLGLKRLIIIEFPSVEVARKVYESEEYRRDILPHRLKWAKSDLVIVEGAE